MIDKMSSIHQPNLSDLSSYFVAIRTTDSDTVICQKERSNGTLSLWICKDKDLEMIYVRES